MKKMLCFAMLSSQLVFGKAISAPEINKNSLETMMSIVENIDYNEIETLKHLEALDFILSEVKKQVLEDVIKQFNSYIVSKKLFKTKRTEVFKRINKDITKRADIYFNKFFETLPKKNNETSEFDKNKFESLVANIATEVRGKKNSMKKINLRQPGWIRRGPTIRKTAECLLEYNTAKYMIKILKSFYPEEESTLSEFDKPNSNNSKASNANEVDSKLTVLSIVKMFVKNTREAHPE